MVHPEDMAEGFVRVVDSRRHGEVFNLTDSSRASVGEMAAAVAKAAGYDGKIEAIPVEEAVKTIGQTAVCLAMDQQVSSSKAAQVLGWQPRQPFFTDDVATYLEAWKAFHTRG